MARRGLVLRAALALAVSAGLAAVLARDVLGAAVEPAVSELSQLAAAAAAAAACAAAARRAGAEGQGGLRTAWALLAAATGSWAAGQAAWSAYELGLGVPPPVPSVADVGYVGFLVLAAAGLVRWLAADVRAVTWGRDLLDGAIIASSLLLFSWLLARAGGDAGSADGALLALLSWVYPVGDVVLATLVLLVLTRSTQGQRTVLVLVAAGLGALAVSDGVWSYVATAGDDGGLQVVGAGWVLGFLLIAVAAGGSSTARHGTGRAGGATVVTRAAWRLRVTLPYLPMVAAEAVVVRRAVVSGRLDGVEAGIGVALVVLVLVRQLLVLDENRRLLEELAAAQEQLRHQALHDPLTGLANRVLFADRVQHALAVRPHARSAVTVLYCDLDGFKAVNDGRGHAAGDELLRLVAGRLRSCLRPSDTVARLGGDEFAVLLEDSADPAEVARRLLAAAARPCLVEGSVVAVTMSVGLATAGPADLGAAETCESLLRRADDAMYRSKAAGGGRVAGEPEEPAGGGAAAVGAPVTA